MSWPGERRTVSDTKGAVLHTKTGEPKSRDFTDISDTSLAFPSGTKLTSSLEPRDFGTHPTPVVRLTFSSRVSWLTKARAFSYAAAQSPAPEPQGEG